MVQSKEGITLVQKRHAKKMLDESGMSECNAVHVPIDSGLKLSMAPD